MKWKSLSAAAFAVLLMTGCLGESTVEGVFVSGHLGNYMDCPGDGYSGDLDEAARSSDAPEGDAGACSPGVECGPLNCEDGQVTLRLVNGGELTVDGLQLERVELLDENGRYVADLPLINVSNTVDGGAFDGELEPAEEVDLRVDFLGPEDLTELTGASDHQDSGFIRITFEADDHRDIVIPSTELYVLPSVVT